MASRADAQTAESGATRGRLAALARAGKIGGALLGTAIAALVLAQSVQAQTANQWRYQYDEAYHIIYYSPEAFECISSSNEARVTAAILKTQAEIEQLNYPLSVLLPFDRRAYGTQIDAIQGIIGHLKDILSRLQKLPRCTQPATEEPGNPGLPPSPDNTYQNGNGGVDQNGNGGPDQNGNGDPGSNGGGPDASSCSSGNNGGDQGNCAQNQYWLNNGSNNHNDGGSGHHKGK